MYKATFIQGQFLVAFFYVVTMIFGFYCGVWAFVIGLSQISSFLSMNLDLVFVKLNQFSREARLFCPLLRHKKTP